jgi:hypothetical protein
MANTSPSMELVRAKAGQLLLIDVIRLPVYAGTPNVLTSYRCPRTCSRGTAGSKQGALRALGAGPKGIYQFESTIADTCIYSPIQKT